MKEEIVDKLITYFQNESQTDIAVPSSYIEKRKLLRGLINMRSPKSLDENILALEDELLQLELKEKQIINSQNLPEVEKNISLFLGDITTLEADAIVNAGNSYGLGCFSPNHNCIDNVIHTYAGIRLRLECYKKLAGRELNNGDILVCNAYNLPSKYVITTVGPCIRGNITKQDEIDLSKCYENALKYAIKNNFKTIVFPSISTGVFSFPINKAKVIAYETVKKIMSDSDIKVIFNVYSEEDYNEYQTLFRN